MTSRNITKNLSDMYSSEFGKTAVEMGFITETQRNEAMQIELRSRAIPGCVRLLPAILFDEGWMTSVQIEQVLDVVLKRTRDEKPSSPDA